MDCPYYEQLQYVGDTRIQALISLYVSGDDRLMRNAIEQFRNSFAPMDSPGAGILIITYRSFHLFLFWIGMLHDYWRHRPDTAFVQQYLSGIKEVLDWHAKYVDKNNMLSKMPHWNFVDWPDEWPWKGRDESAVYRQVR
jgi:hypothetical protein